jgi:hypothetical protein
LITGATYQDLANRYNISKARVCQMVALIKKLPQEIIDFLSDSSKNIEFFTERRLRPLTHLVSDREKIKKFNEIKKKFAN